MQREYRFTLLSKLFLTGLLLLFPYAIRQTYIDGEATKFLFFLVGFPIGTIGVIFGWLFRLEVDDNKIVCNILCTRKHQVAWETADRIIDDHFLHWHLYHVLAFVDKDLKKERGILLSNFVWKNYPALLANIVTHVKPGTHVDDSILWHLNMAKEDIGKYYKQDKWIDNVKVNSYWKQKLF